MVWSVLWLYISSQCRSRSDCSKGSLIWVCTVCSNTLKEDKFIPLQIAQIQWGFPDQSNIDSVITKETTLILSKLPGQQHQFCQSYQGKNINSVKVTKATTATLSILPRQQHQFCQSYQGNNSNSVKVSKATTEILSKLLI